MLYFNKCIAVAIALVVVATPALAIEQADLDKLTQSVENQAIAWRRDIHEHPELSNRERHTAALAAGELKKLGLEVRTSIAHFGVVAVLRGAKPGPTIALRADMDALPITEKSDLPFRSRETVIYRGQKVGVMHACGHDAHTAILLAVAKVLTALRQELSGNVVFVFQPAEEGAPESEEGGSALMLKENLFGEDRPQVIFGLHVWSTLSVGEIGYRSGPMMAATDPFRLDVHGKQTHGARPWDGIDPIVTAAQLINDLQTIVSRRIDLTEYPAVVTVGAINGGIRNNIIPDRVEMLGTIRSFTPQQRTKITDSLREMAAGASRASGADVEFTIMPGSHPVTVNDPALTAKMLPSLERAVGADHVTVARLTTAAEDFSRFAEIAPSLFFFVGSTSPELDPGAAPANHSEYFLLDERSLLVGIRALSQLAVDFLGSGR